VVKGKLKGIGAALFLCGSASGSFTANAASESVGVSITFEVAPADLFKARAIAPEEARSCELLSARVDRIWRTKQKPPAIHCATEKDMPLIGTPQSGNDLIVRP